MEISLAGETLKFDDLQQYLLLKNGNFLYKVPFRDGVAVLKVYFGSRGWRGCVLKSFNNWLQDQSSFMPRRRRANELRTMKIWREAGLRVFDTYEDVAVAGLPEGGYTLFEYVEGTKFTEYFTNPDVSLDDKRAMWRRYLAEAGRRHESCIRNSEPALIHENGDLKHVVILADGDLLYFDFEVTYRTPGKVRRHIAREILAFLRSLGRYAGPESFPAFVEDTRQYYPHPDLLKECYTIMYRHPNPVHRMARALERLVKPRARKPFSIHSVARLFADE